MGWVWSSPANAIISSFAFTVLEQRCSSWCLVPVPFILLPITRLKVWNFCSAVGPFIFWGISSPTTSIYQMFFWPSNPWQMESNEQWLKSAYCVYASTFKSQPATNAKCCVRQAPLVCKNNITFPQDSCWIFASRAHGFNAVADYFIALLGDDKISALLFLPASINQCVENKKGHNQLKILTSSQSFWGREGSRWD